MSVSYGHPTSTSRDSQKMWVIIRRSGGVGRVRLILVCGPGSPRVGPSGLLRDDEVLMVFGGCILVVVLLSDNGRLGMV